MRVLVFGGTGFVGLNIAAVLLARGHAVTLYDRAGLPPAAARAFTPHDDRLNVIQGDVTDREAVERVINVGYDTVVLGAAITAGSEREATSPGMILQVNLLAQAPILAAARRAGVKRVVNLSSAAAYGASAFSYPLLEEGLHCDPTSLYAITKFASEKVAARLASLWSYDIISVRLSAVFGPWEYSNDVRDTPSPQAQILAAWGKQRDATLHRPGIRDWIYAPDVGEAVALLVEASKPKHQLYNISSGQQWSALQWGQQLTVLHPGLICRLAEPGETPTVDLFSSVDRAPLSVARMAEEFDWRARFGCAESAADLGQWWTKQREKV